MDDMKPQPGIESEKDVEAKAQIGTLYTAVREVTGVTEILRSWEDLDPKVQYMFCIMVAGHEDNPARVALMTLLSFISFCNSEEGQASASIVGRLFP